MSIYWLLPGVVIALVMAVSTGYWPLLAIAALTLIAGLAARGQAALRQPLGAPELVLEGCRLWLDRRRLPRRICLWGRGRTVRVIAALNAQLPVAPMRALEECYALRPRGVLRLGLGERGPLDLDLTTHPHTLIVGPTGSGKSVLLARLLHQISTDALPGWIFDYKGGETLAENASLCAGFECGLSEDGRVSGERWQALLATVRSRPPSRETQLIVVVEELGAALSDPVALPALLELAAQGRSRGVRLLATNQSSGGIPRQLLVNLGNRILLAGADSGEALLLGAPAGAAVSAKASTSTTGDLAVGGVSAGGVSAGGVSTGGVLWPNSPRPPGQFSGYSINQITNFHFLATWANRS